ncbi:MAG: bifunctional phosphopantothenoylcysteine decarboxylase/phosphopantothenate--cysteine ligase CoaBC [Gemmatimonadetes bacterium]|nr:bifunctional phosphopantothenoylcysteine decarboxylase/phosphopantothenate--cysteine ligase CoaBC [Gemmatimonadota bacterium]
MRPFAGARICLGVTGGIASYKTVFLARLLTQAGAQVDVVLSRSAREFVGAITFEAVTGRPAHTELIAEGRALDHLKLAREANVVVVAPATADFLARSATGQADDLITAILLATRSPVLLVPAMNDKMWGHAQVQANAEHLRGLGYDVLDPDTGPLASPTEGAGAGRMPEPEAIMAEIGRLLEAPGPLAGRHVVVTAGPTREPVDPVRFLSNRSSGRMGASIASAAHRRGARVTLIHGPLEVSLPHGARPVAVETTEEMAREVRAALADADVLIMAAAPADFTAAQPAAQKLKKEQAPESLALARTPDILRTTRDARRPGTIVVGFALETEKVIEHARGKLEAKGLDLVVANDATEPGAGFGTTTNRVTLIGRDGAVEAHPLASKDTVADVILDRVEALLHGR